MPPVAAGAIIAGVAAGSTFVAGALTLGFSWTAFAGSLILGALSYALTPKPETPSFNQSVENSVSNVAVRQPDLTRVHVFGHTRVTRGYAHMQSTGLNGTLHIILILCEGPLRAINEIWLNDYAIPPDWIDADGNVTEGRYEGVLTIKKYLGTENQAADPTAVDNMGSWTNDHRLRGTAYLYLRMEKDQDIFPTGVPNISAIVEGPSVYDPRTQSERWSTNIALMARNFLIDEEYGYGISEDDFDDTNIAAQANICDEIVTISAQDFDVISVDDATDIITLGDDILTLQFGDQVVVSSSGMLPAGLSSATNYFVIPYQIKGNPRIKLAASLDDAMAKIAVDITSQGSGDIFIRKTGEPRYHGSGLIDTESPLSDTMGAIASCMAGRAVNVGGFWTLYAGAWRTPTTTFDIGDLRGSMGVQTAISMSDSFNSVSGLFISQENLYQQTDYPVASYPQFIADDNGIEAPKTINLPYTTRPTTAQRIAKIELFRGRQGIVFTADFSMKGINVKPGDTCNLDIEALGWSEKEFEVTEFSFDTVNNAMVTKMVLRETAQEIFDWDAGEAIDFDPAPNTDLPDPFTVTVVVGFSLDSIVVQTLAGDFTYKVIASWLEHENAFVRQGGWFEIESRKSGDTAFSSVGQFDGSSTQAEIQQLELDTLYDIRIFAFNNLGVRSQPTIIENFVVGTSSSSDTEDWENITEPRDGSDWENDTEASENWES